MPQPAAPPAELPDLPLVEKRRLQNLAHVASRRIDHLAGQIAGFRAGVKLAEPLNATEAMRRAEEMMTDYAHLGHGLRDLLRTAKSIYRDNEARKAAAHAASGDVP